MQTLLNFDSVSTPFRTQSQLQLVLNIDFIPYLISTQFRTQSQLHSILSLASNPTQLNLALDFLNLFILSWALARWFRFRFNADSKQEMFSILLEYYSGYSKPSSSDQMIDELAAQIDAICA